MADPRYPYWIQDMAPAPRAPTTAGVLRLAVLVLIIVIAWQWFAGMNGGGVTQVDRRPGVSLCEEHAGDPAWRSICAEARRW